VKVAFGALAFGLKVPVPPEMTDHAPVPTVGVLPPRPEVVPRAQIAGTVPAEAGVGAGVIVMVTSAVASGHGGFETVQRRTIGPMPLVWVKTASGALAFGLNDPVPPETTDHVPVPIEGELPPRLAEEPAAQIVCGPPAVATRGTQRTLVGSLATSLSVAASPPPETVAVLAPEMALVATWTVTVIAG